MFKVRTSLLCHEQTFTKPLFASLKVSIHELPEKTSTVSSAHEIRLMLSILRLHTPIIWIRNRIGPRAVPCGTPIKALDKILFLFTIFMHCVLPEK